MKILITCFLLIATLFTSVISGQVSGVYVNNLKVEGLKDLKGWENYHPRLSWQISASRRNVIQTGYQIIVAGSLKEINKNWGVIWNSAKVASDASINIAYPLNNLLSCRQYYWKVRVWTNKGISEWSTPGKWNMGIIDSAIWKSKWIGYNNFTKKDDPYNIHTRLSARYFRREVEIKKVPIRATAFICGLGLYELNINGKKVGEDVLTPTVKQYDKFLPYNTLDVTNYFIKGRNAIGVILGNGRFFTARYSADGGMVDGISSSTNYGFPKLIMQVLLEFSDGRRELIITDDKWRVTDKGPIISNNEFDGEEYDANKELSGWSSPGYNSSNWSNVQLILPPAGKLVSQTNENISIKDSLNPKSITKTKNNSFILDMGQNMVGWLKISVNGKKGDTVILRFAESLKGKDSLFLDNIRSAQVTDKYILKGIGLEVWQPRFVYHGFRYVEVKGLRTNPSKRDFTGMVVYDNIPSIGLFETSNKTLNGIYKNAYWTIIGNYRGMPTDCPQRDERMGWLGDRSVNSYGESFLFDNSRLYAKWMDDIQAAQKETGSLPDVAPTFWKVYSNNVTWPITYLIVPEMLRKQFGDTITFKKHYPYMKKWIMYMWDNYEVDGLVLNDTYGDWCLPPESLEMIFSKDSTRNTYGPLIGSAYYYYALTLMRSYAFLLGLDNDMDQFEKLAKKVKISFNKKFYHPDSGYYANNTVTSNLLPLTFGLVNENERKCVFDHIVERTLGMYNGHVSTGLIGGQWLMRGLSDNGRPDIAFQIASNTTYPSWGYMAKQGATTIWELWNGNTANPAMNSGNHVMLLGDLLVWFYEYLAGIKSDSNKIAFKQILMNPYIAPELTYVNASTSSPYGIVKSNWQLKKDIFYWKVTIPVNSSAVLTFPVTKLKKIRESGIAADKIDGIKVLRAEHNKISFEIGSGTYLFTCPIR